MAKLLVQMLPLFTWRKNVRAAVSYEIWAGLRWSFGAQMDRPQWLSVDLDRVITHDKMRCSICKKETQHLQLHEEWKFDDRRKIQSLHGLRPLCEECHLSIHFGRASQLGVAERAMQHLCDVNDWSEAEAEAHIASAQALCLERSAVAYRVDLSWLNRLIPKSKIHLDWLDGSSRWVGDRLSAAGWARTVLDGDVYIVDCETTGLREHKRSEIIEIAVMTGKGHIVYNARFRPRYKIPIRTTRIHGITNKAVAKCPSFAEVGSTLLSLIEGKRVVTYNANFDRELLARTCRLHTLDPVDCRWECAMQAYRSFKEIGRYLPLPEGKHSAIDDARATLKLIRRMARDI